LTYSLTVSPVVFSLAFSPTPLGADELLLVDVRRVCATGEPSYWLSWFYQTTALAAPSPVNLYDRWCVHHSPPWAGQAFTVRVTLVSGGTPGSPVDVSAVAGG